jgi:hypothetical protein
MMDLRCVDTDLSTCPLEQPTGWDNDFNKHWLDFLGLLQFQFIDGFIEPEVTFYLYILKLDFEHAGLQFRT